MARDQTLHRNENVFVIRTWHEHSTYGADQRRASITHVVSGERRYFRRVDEIEAFIDRFTQREAEP